MYAEFFLYCTVPLKQKPVAEFCHRDISSRAFDKPFSKLFNCFLSPIALHVDFSKYKRMLSLRRSFLSCKNAVCKHVGRHMNFDVV